MIVALLDMLRDFGVAIRDYPRALRQGLRDLLADELELLLLVFVWLLWVAFLATMLTGSA